MKIKVDTQNKAVIAIGYYQGEKIKAVSVCHNGDTFDEQFGIELTKNKYKKKLILKKIAIAKQEFNLFYNLFKEAGNYINLMEDNLNLQDIKIDSIVNSKYE